MLCFTLITDLFLLGNRYMVQLLNLVVQNLGAPALHNSGFAVSSVHPLHSGLYFLRTMKIMCWNIHVLLLFTAPQHLDLCTKSFTGLELLWLYDITGSTWKYVVFNLRKFPQIVYFWNTIVTRWCQSYQYVHEND